MEQLLLNIGNIILTKGNLSAFFINGTFYNYSDFGTAISKIRNAITNGILESEKNIGLVANDDLETYAAIIALWLEGKAYVLLSPETPKDRNENIIQQAILKTIIDSSDTPLFLEYNLIESKKLQSSPINLVPNETSDQELAYILFTSGTTGHPKGVPISRKNIAGFVKAFWDIGFEINDTDRCLQMFELTFDLSVMSYFIPLLKGACIYTIPKDKIKFAFIEQLMDEHKLTVALMVPSILHYLRPYFNEINCPDMKYSLFCGEALYEDITKEWSECLPNARILNVYGPTEDTIFCTHYSYNRTEINKTHNGILSIGKAMEGTKTIIVDENNQILPYGEKGQLCLGGEQLTPGYWNNEEKNIESFFYLNDKGIEERFYKTGDLCLYDEEGDILYLGRLDSQVKIQGFRVELSEIEFHAKTFLENMNIVALPINDAVGNTEIALVIESKYFETVPLQNHLKLKLPSYMLPKQIGFVESFALNSNGKIDRKKLSLIFNK